MRQWPLKQKSHVTFSVSPASPLGVVWKECCLAESSLRPHCLSLVTSEAVISPKSTFFPLSHLFYSHGRTRGSVSLSISFLQVKDRGSSGDTIVLHSRLPSGQLSPTVSLLKKVVDQSHGSSETRTVCSVHLQDQIQLQGWWHPSYLSSQHP